MVPYYQCTQGTHEVIYPKVDSNQSYIRGSAPAIEDGKGGN